MLSIQRGRPEIACNLIKQTVKDAGWLEPVQDNPTLASEGETQWWSEDRLREELRDLATSIALRGDNASGVCADIGQDLVFASKGRVLYQTARKIAWLRSGLPDRYQALVSQLQTIWDQQSLTFIEDARSGQGMKDVEDYINTPPWKRAERPRSERAHYRQSLRERESTLLQELLPHRGPVPTGVASSDWLAEIRGKIPEGAALVEYFRFLPYTGRKVRNSGESIFDEDR
jgi:hypothetical protein